MAKGKIFIGTSGWSNSHWKGIIYTEKAKSPEFLPQYAEHFSATEINSSFYRLPKIQTVEKWVESVPAGFRFCVKMSKFLTHIKRLKEPEEPLERFFNIFKPMQPLLGPVLIQLPPSLKFDAELAENFFILLQEKYKANSFALEARHNTWLENESIDLLTKYKISFVIAQSNNLFPYAELITAKNIYVRFHGPGKLFASSYSDESLLGYAKKFLQWQKQGHQVWAFFNNTATRDAINNARTLQSLCRRNIS